jgi:hypothetical protein
MDKKELFLNGNVYKCLTCCTLCWCHLCRLLALTSLAKWLMAALPSRTACNACSGLITLHALNMPDLLATTSPSALTASPASRKLQSATHKAAAAVAEPTGVGVALVDLCLVASTSLSAGGLLAEAAQLLLAALLHPAQAGSFAVPALPPSQQQEQGLARYGSLQQPVQAYPAALDLAQEQQQRQVVFMSGSSAAAASCWPPAVLQLAVAHQWDQLHCATPHHHQQQQGAIQQQQNKATPQHRLLSLDHLPDWLPLLVLSSAAAVSHPNEVPGELLAAVAAGLIDVLLAAAPGPASCTAAGWLCQLLRSGAWGTWRPYIGKPAYLMHRWGAVTVCLCFGRAGWQGHCVDGQVVPVRCVRVGGWCTVSWCEQQLDEMRCCANQTRHAGNASAATCICLVSACLLCTLTR